MTTPTHDPLTAEHIALLNEAPFELTPVQQDAAKYRSVGFLCQAGYLHTEQTHIGAEVSSSRFRFTRTAKPLPSVV